MIVVRSGRHAAQLVRHLRERAGLTRRQAAARLFVSHKTVCNREHAARSLSTDDLIDHAHISGYDVALVPARHPGARPTGTGWPA